MDEKAKELLAEIGQLFQDAASSVLPMLLPKEIGVALGEIGEWSPEAYPETMVLVTSSFSEGPGGSVYFVLSSKLASIVVDLMLGGEGSDSRPVNEESKDALKEMINQLLGVLSTSMRERYEGAAAFAQVEVHSLEPNIDLKLLLGDAALSRIPLDLSLEGDAIGTMAACIPEDTFASLRKDLIEAEPGQAEVKAEQQPSEDEDPVAAALTETAAEAPEPPPPSADQISDAAVAANVGLILDIELPIVVRLGSAEMTLQEIVKLGPGSIIELNKSVEEPVELLVNNKLIAKGEVVVVEGNFAFRVTEIKSKTSRIQSLR